jgi:hypothetical protein
LIAKRGKKKRLLVFVQNIAALFAATNNGLEQTKISEPNAGHIIIPNAINYFVCGLLRCKTNFRTISLFSLMALISMCINNWAYSTNFKAVTISKHCSDLTGKCFEMPTPHTRDR